MYFPSTPENMVCHTNMKRLLWGLICIVLVNNPTYAIKDDRYNSLMCNEIDFQCKYCDNHELDCTSRGILDGMLTSPMFSLAAFVPNNTTVINLSGNALTYLTIDYAEMWIDGLKTLIINHNNIQMIHSDTFKGLQSLEILDMSYNLIEFLQSDIFDQLEGLQTLDLSHNLLSRIDGFWFQGPRELIRLNLSYNQIGIFKNIGRT